ARGAALGSRQRNARGDDLSVERLPIVPRRRRPGRHARSRADGHRLATRRSVSARGDREAGGGASYRGSRRSCSDGERRRGARHPRQRRRVLGPHSRRGRHGPRAAEIRAEESRPGNRRVADAVVRDADPRSRARRSRRVSLDAARCEMTRSRRSPERLALLRFPLRVVAAVMTLSAALVAQSGDWLMYSGSYSSHRFSPLTELTPDNVAKLRPVWVYQPPGTGSLEATPVVVNGVMYVTSGPAMVAALDLRSGKPLWEWTRPIAASVLNLGFPRVNRGVAILDNTV